jgi:hypothetical membrane protein
MQSRSNAAWLSRGLGIVAVVGPVVCVAGWVIASATQHDFHPVRDELSFLAANGADHPWITAVGETLLGLSILALAVGVGRSLAGPDAWIGCTLLVIAGTTSIVQALARENCPPNLCGVQAGGASWHDTTHQITSSIALLALLSAPLALTRPFREQLGWRRITTYSTATFVVGLAMLIAFVSASDTGWGGAGEWAFITPLVAWIAVVGAHMTIAPAGKRARESAPQPLSQRDRLEWRTP